MVEGYGPTDWSRFRKGWWRETGESTYEHLRNVFHKGRQRNWMIARKTRCKAHMVCVCVGGVNGTRTTCLYAVKIVQYKGGKSIQRDALRETRGRRSRQGGQGCLQNVGWDRRDGLVGVE